jgi:phosphoglucosamine mutase
MANPQKSNAPAKPNGNGERRIFGTDGVRGTANIEPVTAETALKLGRAAAHIFAQRTPSERTTIVIGKDTRLSCYMLENALAAGVMSLGADVLFIGPLPTPGVAYITRSLRADAGIVLSASHNPYEDNGIKFFRHDGYKLDDEVEQRIEDLFFSGEIEAIRPTAGRIGRATRIDDAMGRYVEFAKQSFPRGMTLDGVRIAVDCANGAAYKSTPCILRELGADAVIAHNTPNGRNINRECGSMHPEEIQRLVKETKAQIGISHDGDADRVVATVMSNFGLDETLKKHEGRVLRTKVGDRYVIEAMMKQDLNVGGEQSGHMIFRDFSTTGDGIVSALQILRIMVETGQPLSELRKCLAKYPQAQRNLKVREKRPIEELPGVVRLIAETETELAGAGRVLLRYSGTESKIRLLIEGRDGERINAQADRIADVIQEAIGV